MSLDFSVVKLLVLLDIHLLNPGETYLAPLANVVNKVSLKCCFMKPRPYAECTPLVFWTHFIGSSASLPHLALTIVGHSCWIEMSTTSHEKCHCPWKTKGPIFPVGPLSENTPPYPELSRIIDAKFCSQVVVVPLPVQSEVPVQSRTGFLCYIARH